MKTQCKLRLVVLISGNGSNLQAIIDAIDAKLLPAEIAAVISDQSSAYGLKRAAKHNLVSILLAKKPDENRNKYDEALATCIQKFNPDLIVLAGFMRILGPYFLETFSNKIINIHPSLLPKYPGLNTHELVLKEAALEHGCSIHFVNENLDAGPLIAQAAIKVRQDDSVDSLKGRVQIAEHFLYPTVINWFANNRLKLKDNRVFFDDFPLTREGFKLEIKLR